MPSKIDVAAYRTNFAKQALRRASYRWYGRWQAAKKAVAGRGLRTCKKCKKVVHYKAGQMDHVKPVVDPKKGWEGFDAFVERLLVEERGFQFLCDQCHKEKTRKENEQRSASRRAKKSLRKCS